MLALAAACPIAAGGDGWPGGDPGPTEPAGGRIVRVTSGRCVGLDPRVACQEAEGKAREGLLAELAQLAEAISGQRLSGHRLVREQAWLLGQPDVEQNAALHVEEKPYGPVAEKRVTVTIGSEALARWSKRLAQQHSRRTVRLFGAAMATLAGWLGALVLITKLDRATGGYYRRVLVPAAFLALVAATVSGWMWLVGLE